MIRPLIIGQAPARGNDGLLPFAGRSGARLAYLAGVGTSGDDLPAHFVLTNLLDRYPGKQGSKGDRFDKALGKERAEEIMRVLENPDRYSRWVIFMGKTVARAFGFRHHPYLVSWSWNQHSFIIFPHPSGINRWWNDPANEAQASRILKEILSG